MAVGQSEETYKEENEAFIPNPTDAAGTVETTGIPGTGVDDVSPVFEQSRVRSAVTAKRALDPEDNEVDQSLVILPQSNTGEQERKDAIERINKAAEQAEGPSNQEIRESRALGNAPPTEPNQSPSGTPMGEGGSGSGEQSFAGGSNREGSAGPAPVGSGGGGEAGTGGSGEGTGGSGAGTQGS